MIDEKPRQDQFTCPVCYATFSTEEELTEHSRSHGGPQKSAFRCSACGAVFNTEAELAIHMESHLESRFATPAQR